MNSKWAGAVSDQWEPATTISSNTVHQGGKWNVVEETALIGGQQVVRDVVVHPGAVAVVALNELRQIYLLRQYRHPVGAYLWETPAGLLDDPNEEPLAAAKRELAEEAGLVAGSWHVLVDFLNSPGGSTEAIRVYLAQEVTELPGGRVPTGEAEEIDLPGIWIDLGQAIELVFAGAVGNPTTVIGVLAAEHALKASEAHLREPESPWHARDNLRVIGRIPLG